MHKTFDVLSYCVHQPPWYLYPLLQPTQPAATGITTFCVHFELPSVLPLLVLSDALAQMLQQCLKTGR